MRQTSAASFGVRGSLPHVEQGGWFMATHLRVFPESHEPATREQCQDPVVHVSLGDLLPLLSLAKRHHYAWLQDFLDDEVAITPDLYDVLCAFSDYRRPSA
jgi:hypothetical protein